MYEKSLVHTYRLRLRLRQTLRIGSMATNDGVQAKHLHLTAKIKEKTQTQTLSMNTA